MGIITEIAGPWLVADLVMDVVCMVLLINAVCPLKRASQAFFQRGGLQAQGAPTRQLNDAVDMRLLYDVATFEFTAAICDVVAIDKERAQGTR